MKKLTSILLIAMTLFMFQSCEKTEDVVPDDQTEDPGDGGGNNNGNVNEVDVFGLNQNFVKADSKTEVKLTSTLVESYGEGNDVFTKLSFLGVENTLITIITKGSELKVGNYSLKKFQLLDNPTETEAVVSVAINSTLLDFQLTETDHFSISQDANGFFVIKMAPTVGIKRNDWDPELTAPISFHIMTNPAEITVSTVADGNIAIDLYAYEGDGSSAYVGINHLVDIYLDGDFSANTIAKASHVLSTGETGNRMSSWKNWKQYISNPDKEQRIEFELTAKTIIIKYTDIEFIGKLDPSLTFTTSGSIEIAR